MCQNRKSVNSDGSLHSDLFECAVSLQPHPFNLSTLSTLPTSATFVWKEFILAPGVTATVTGYEYRLYRNISTEQCLFVGTVQGRNNTKVVVRNLKPNRNYGFSVAAIIDNTTLSQFTPRHIIKTPSGIYSVGETIRIYPILLQ